MWWALRYNEVPQLYFAYGLDRDGHRVRDAVSIRELSRQRDGTNRTLQRDDYGGRGYDYVVLYVVLLRDKFVFAQFVASLGYRTPRNLAFLTPGSVRWVGQHEKEPLDALVSPSQDIDGFCKPHSGGFGKGAFRLRATYGALTVDGEPATVDDVRARLDGCYLLQERVVQHEGLALLHPPSINTLRVMTALEGEKARPLAVVLRVGARGRLVDNWASGGFVVPVDLGTGELRGPGFFKAGKGNGTTTPRHPDSGVELDGYPIPFFHEAVEAACRLHEDVGHLYTVGWDVAVTADGPSFIEGNDDWDVSIPLVVEPGFSEKWRALF